MMFVCVLDMVLLAMILLCSMDVLRQIRPARQPWRTLAFALTCVGTLGCMGGLVRGDHPAMAVLALHGGFALYSVMRLQARNAAAAREPNRYRLRRTT